jgi:flagellin FlaB
LTVQYVSDDDFANLVVGNDSRTAADQAAGDTPPENTSINPNSGTNNYIVDVITAENEDDLVMTDGSDRYELVIPLAKAAVTDEEVGEAGGAGQAQFDQADLSKLDEGEELELRITTEVGSQTVAFLQVPDSLSGDDAGSTVNL